MNETETAYQSWIGRTRVDRDLITPRLVESFDATLDRPARDWRAGDAAPSGVQWLLAPPRVARSGLGPDGHPSRGGFLPPITLPRRMWASGQLDLLAPLRVEDTVDLTSRIATVTPKSGSSGTLVFVEVDHEYAVDGELRVRERQTIVYRDPPKPGAATSGAPASKAGPSDWTVRRCLTPDSTMLFRYSALTFNGHRIHYDQDYVRGEEGYPDLIVHGPLTATLLLHLGLEAMGDGPVRFSFRGLSPLFVGRAIELRGRPEQNGFALEAADNDGRSAMRAELAPLGPERDAR